MMWSYNTVSAEISLIINESVHIDTLHSFVRQYPKETTDTAGVFTHHFPIVV